MIDDLVQGGDFGPSPLSSRLGVSLSFGVLALLASVGRAAAGNELVSIILDGLEWNEWEGGIASATV